MRPQETARALVCALGSLSLLLVAPAALAGTILPGVYQLLDHGDGELGPDYGLRMDSLGEVFSVELGSASVELSWDGSSTANISGLLRSSTAELWTIDYDLTGVVAVGTQGFTATGGTERSPTPPATRTR